ncbi:hypothetical protein Hanom_Chr12g01124781 [Helianthus anomalus]
MINENKGRKHTSPLAICVGDVKDWHIVVTDHLHVGLVEGLLPRSVTVVLTRGLVTHCRLYMVFSDFQ